MKYLKSCLWAIGIILITVLLSSSLSYFNIINNVFKNILEILGSLLGFFIAGLNIGTKSQNKGYLEGIKVGGILVVLFLVLSQLLFRDSFSIWKLLYYIVLLLLSVAGSITGINSKKTSES